LKSPKTEHLQQIDEDLMRGPDRRLAAEKTGKPGISPLCFPSLTPKGYVFLIFSVHKAN